jgi:beta-mannosidase
MNDCWPVTSWSIVDYFLRPKPAYYTIKRELRPFTVGMVRKEIKTFANEYSAADFTIETFFEIWATNSTLDDKTMTLEVMFFDLEADYCLRERWERDVVLVPNASTELWRGKLPGQPDRRSDSDVPKSIVVSARLICGETVFARHSIWWDRFSFELHAGKTNGL